MYGRVAFGSSAIDPLTFDPTGQPATDGVILS
jgi:hypothetical protein